MRRSALGWLAAGALVALAACGDEGIQRIRPELVPPQAELDFGAVPVLNEKTVAVPLLNVGRAELRVESVTITEADVPFRVVSSPTEIGSGEEHPVELAFVPPLEQDYQATLVLVTDDQTHPTLEVKLIGKGSTRAIMVVEPESLDFGRVAEGTSAVKTLTIQSTGSADLVVEDLAFADGSSPAFEFLGSVKTPVVVPTTDTNGLPGKVQLTLRYTVEAGAPDTATATVRIRGTDPDKREVTVPITGAVNRAPLPVIAPLGVGAPGLKVTLDGMGSSDPDGDTPLTYKWTLRSKPLGATTVIAADDQPITEMTLDSQLPGEYVVELNVTDSQGAKNLTAARASIVAAPAEKLMVEMFWNNTGTDIDLHVLRTPQVQVGTLPDDCFYQNKTPDWGVVGDPGDDPRFKKDAPVGFGPEVFGYVNPVDTTYRIVAEFRNEHVTPQPASEITVRIYQFGVVKGEFKKTLNREGEVWTVADLQWPSGIITPIEQ